MNMTRICFENFSIFSVQNGIKIQIKIVLANFRYFVGKTVRCLRFKSRHSLKVIIFSQQVKKNIDEWMNLSNFFFKTPIPRNAMIKVLLFKFITIFFVGWNTTILFCFAYYYEWSIVRKVFAVWKKKMEYYEDDSINHVTRKVSKHFIANWFRLQWKL